MKLFSHTHQVFNVFYYYIEIIILSNIQILLLLILFNFKPLASNLRKYHYNKHNKHEFLLITLLFEM